MSVKRHDDVTTMFSNRLKNFKHVRRKFFKHRKENKIQSASEKFKREKKIEKKKNKITF